jgi:hypothetical protein
MSGDQLGRRDCFEVVERPAPVGRLIWKMTALKRLGGSMAPNMRGLRTLIGPHAARGCSMEAL